MTEYTLLFKTGQSEFRAWDNFSKNLQARVNPFIEITRGRKVRGAGKNLDDDALISTAGIYDFSKQVDRIRNSFSSSGGVTIDLTREKSLTCAEIEDLANDDNCYENWVNFVSLFGENGIFNPCIVVNPKAECSFDEYKKNLVGQFDLFAERHRKISYRAQLLSDTNFIADLHCLKESVSRYVNEGGIFEVLLDHEYIRPGTGILHAARSLGLIRSIDQILEQNPKYVILSTSFPRYIEDIGNAEHDVFPQEELILFENIVRELNYGDRVNFGDYGSINPIRNDVLFTQGWRPRIDTPLNTKTFYYREKREKNQDYAHHYISVAKKTTADERFIDLRNRWAASDIDSWGVGEIEKAARGTPSQKAPSFWISVRMEIHLVHRALEDWTDRSRTTR